MITLIVCIKRKPGMTREEFSRHYREHHGPLVMSVPQFSKYLRKYSQFHVTDPGAAGELFGTLSDYDAIAMLTFESAEDIKRALSEPRYFEVIRPDEGNFIDPANCLSFVTREYEMMAPAR